MLPRRCPYYKYADYSLNGKLTEMDSTTDAYNTTYFDHLDSASNINDVCGSSFLDALATSFPDFSALAVCDTYYQALSHFPGRGPCYPVYAATVPYFNR